MQNMLKFMMNLNILHIVSTLIPKHKRLITLQRQFKNCGIVQPLEWQKRAKSL